jgi:flagellar FliL protein
MADEDRDELMEAAAGEFNPDDDDFGDDQDGRGKGGKKKLIFVVLGLLLLGGGGAGVYFSGMLDGAPTETDQVAAAPPPPPAIIYFDMPDMLVNIDSAGARPSFLKIRASLELIEGTDTVKLGELLPRVVDKFQTYLRELRLDDLKSGEGLRRLREELRIHVNIALSPIEVRDILFRDILIQ